MKLLDKDELRVAEGVLSKHLPHSYKVYGFLFGINRGKPASLEVVVDSWPDFKVIICRPDPKSKWAQDIMKKVSCYCMDRQVFKDMFTRDDVIDWNTDFMLGGLDQSLAPVVEEVSSIRKVPMKPFASVHLLYIADMSHLVTASVDSELESRISSLNLSHADLVNQTWKFGGNEKSSRLIRYYISNFPTCCILNQQGEPVSWILVYDYGAMGLMYTLPEHRRKGYGKVLVNTLAKRLHAEGHPLYCYIEEENRVSNRLFINLGFTEDPSYRAKWFEFGE